MTSPVTAGPAAASIVVRRLTGFDDPLASADQWDRLLAASATDVVYLCREWVQAWWETLGAGDLILLAAMDDDRCVALAPLCCHNGTVFLVGSGNGDHLDFIGDTGRPGVLEGFVRAMAAAAPDFNGGRLWCVREESPTSARIEAACEAAGLIVWLSEEWVAPFADLSADRAAVEAACDSPSIKKRERWFERGGPFEFRQTSDPAEIRKRLPDFFAQHLERFANSSTPSPYDQPADRAFFEQLTERLGPAGGLRFSWLEWNGRAIAFEYGWVHRRTYFGGPSTFATDLATRSPGQILQRRLMMAALAEGLAAYDYGTGGDAYKLRYAPRSRRMFTWKLGPRPNPGPQGAAAVQ